MTSDRLRVATALAGAGGLFIGIIVTLALQGHVLGAQSSGQRRVIRPEKAPNTGLPFSPGILVGNTLYISGHTGRDPVSARLATGGIEGETRQSLANIREVLGNAGMDFKDVVSVTAFITDFK